MKCPHCKTECADSKLAPNGIIAMAVPGCEFCSPLPVRGRHYKLATWSPRVCTFVDGKVTYLTETLARADARGPGRYRVSVVDREDGRQDGEPFDVAGKVAGYEIDPGTGNPVAAGVVCKCPAAFCPMHGRRYPKRATRPMGGRPH